MYDDKDVMAYHRLEYITTAFTDLYPRIDMIVHFLQICYHFQRVRNQE